MIKKDNKIIESPPIFLLIDEFTQRNIKIAPESKRTV